jgi:protein-S-isoprenylcysteine O-methyltransferase Ste14
MYFGFILWIIGWLLYNGAGMSTIPGILGALHILLWQHWEEKAVETQFGEEYIEYKKRTWF